MNDKKKQADKLQIKGTADSLQEQLTNIAKNKGLTRTDFLRKEFMKIMEQYPEPPANQQKQPSTKTLAVFGLPKAIENKIKKTAAAMNLDPSDFLKPHLHALAESFPDHMKKPPLPY